jgi:hypothetical protein
MSQKEPSLDEMTLRDLVAMFALEGALTRESFADGFDFREKAVWVYEMSTAMLEERKKYAARDPA